MVDVPVDIYTSSSEIIIVVPVWWTNKESLSLVLEKNVLILRGERIRPVIKDSAVPLQETCFWWVFEKRVDLPEHVYFDKIHSELTPENILIVIVPKITKPDEIPVKIL